jgi:hypothetical protein
MAKVAGRPLLQPMIERLQVQGFGRSRLAINDLARQSTILSVTAPPSGSTPNI